VTTPAGIGLLAFGPSYSLSSTGALPSGSGSTVQVTWDKLFGTNGGDKLALFPKGAADNAPVANTTRFTNGTASASGNGLKAGTVTIPIPATQAPGNYEIRLISGHTGTALASLAYAVFGPPTAATGKSFSTNSGQKLTVPAATGLLQNATDPDTDKMLLQAQVVAQPAHGSLVLQTDGSFAYTPTGFFSGPDSFTYKVVDPQGLASAPATVNLTVTQVACGPRSTVQVSTAIVSGALQATISSTIGNTPNNRLLELRFGDFQSKNAVVTRNGTPIVSGSTVTLPANTTSVTLRVTRQTPGLATTVLLTVVDTCGTWPTFVGGGTRVGF
jgi:hypothetical protein